jgi:hypothetical protein
MFPLVKGGVNTPTAKSASDATEPTPPKIYLDHTPWNDQHTCSDEAAILFDSAARGVRMLHRAARTRHRF